MVSVPEKLCQDHEICAKILLYMIMFVFLKFGENTHVMAVCMIASSHYLNQCWLHISEVFCHSPESNFIVSVQPISPYKKFKNYTFTLFTVISPKELSNRIRQLRIKDRKTPAAPHSGDTGNAPSPKRFRLESVGSGGKLSEDNFTQVMEDIKEEWEGGRSESVLKLLM